MNQTPLIHLVDDDPAVRDSLALLIGTVGLRVRPWAHPQAFLDGFDREAIGAIVLAVRMPGVGGLQRVEQLLVVDGLFQEFGSATLERAAAHRHRAVTGEHDDGLVGPLCTQRLQHLQPTQAGQDRKSVV